MKKIFVLAILSGVLALINPMTSEAFVSIGGNGALGAWEGSLDFNSVSSTEAELKITLKNVSPIENGGYITAFVLNNPFDLITGITLDASDSDFKLIGGAAFDNTINAAPYGQFDFGASTKNAFQGGGNPSKGVAVGDEEMFAFKLTGTQLDTLTEHVFLSAYSQGTGAGGVYQNVVVRFRGFEDGGSDKVYNGHHMPEPATMAMFGFGAAGAFVRRKYFS